MNTNNPFWKSLGHATDGMVTAFKEEKNIQRESCIGIAACLLGIILRISKGEFLAILICCSTVLSLEYMNSSLEALVDLASPEYNILAKKAKDFSAGAVLLASIFSAAIGLFIFIPHVCAIS